MPDRSKRLEYTNAAKQILSTLTLEQKVSLMGGKLSYATIAAAVKHRGKEHYNEFPYPAGGIEPDIPPMLFCDGPRGVVCGRDKSTCFPVPVLRGATFNTALEEQIGEAIAKEIRAYGGNLFGGVCINLPYHPGWGRCQESYGTDSFLLGAMGSACVRGVQSQGVIACLKHYAFNQMENKRFDVNVTCDKRTEREIFLRHFEKCVKAGAGAVMSAYNNYNGCMCGHNAYLLNDVLKDDWGFDGFVLSDFTWGVKDTVEAANGGQNIEMANTKYFGPKLVEAVRDGLVEESVIEDAALRIIRTLLAFQEDWSPLDVNIIGCKEHKELARKCAEEGITLLKNANAILPLKKKNLTRIVVLGELAEADNNGDHGSSKVYPPYTVTPLKGLLKAIEDDCEIIYYKGTNTRHAVRLAEGADAVIIAAGYNYHDEGEAISFYKEFNEAAHAGGDRTEGLGLHEHEQDTILAVGDVNPSTIVVLFGGGPIMLAPWEEKVPAILYAGYPGMEGGTALANILFGDAEPGGRLPFTIPRNEDDLPDIDWNADNIHYDYWHGYELLEHDGKLPHIPFGYGLSYTTFHISDMHVQVDTTCLRITCKIQNTGTRQGSEVLQVYIGYPHSKVTRPSKRLAGFEKVHLQPKEERAVIITCPLEELMYYEEQSHQFVLEHTDYTVLLATSANDANSFIQNVQI